MNPGFVIRNMFFVNSEQGSGITDGNSILLKEVFRIHDIFVFIRIRIFVIDVQDAMPAKDKFLTPFFLLITF